MRILIVDDHRHVRSTIRRLLRRVEGVEIVEAASAAEGLAALEGVDLMLVDVRLSDDPRDRGGLDLLREVQRSGRRIPAVMVSASSATADLREAMQLGARDYILKDELCEELVVPIVESFRERLALDGEVQKLRARVDGEWGISALLGSSPAMERVRKTVARVAAADAPVLILGETGSGKEMVARAIHQAGPRRDEPFVAINCTAIPGTLLESLLFGHEKGAFTGADRRRRGRIAAAEAGTLLLDEIGDLPLEVQGKLLRVLEDRKFLPVGAEEELPLRGRVIAATNADLQKRVQQGTFRSDLFYRLDVVTIHVPSLAERGPTDFLELLTSFADELPRRLRFTERAVAWLQRRPWPGNVRELKNVIRRLSIMAEGDEIDVPVLEELVGASNVSPPQAIDALVDAILAAPDAGASKYREVERALLRRALDQTGGNHSAAARLLGMDRKAMARRWERLDLGLDERDDDDLH
ncbi:MAG: sigma-54-dependent Fis family transcriptional regulator [Deltaproteobacteria bacterium]|nr:sigma-54-dependent Fis family transcriptional regulator [Deltaproteobacteria bacterium]